MIDPYKIFWLDLVDEGFYGVLIFNGIRWAPLCEDGVFKIGDVAFETWFICGVGVTTTKSSSTPAGTGPYLLLNLSCVPHGDVLVIDDLFVIIFRQIPSCSI